MQLHFSRAWLLYLSIFQISRAEILNFTCKPYLFDSFIWYSFQYSTLCTFTIVRSELPWESIHPQDPPSPIHPFKFRAFPLRVPAIHGIKDRGEITQISFRFFACLNGPSRNRNVEISMAEPSLPRVYPEPWATCVRGAHDFTYKCSYICIPSACI